jgi:chloramphenicol 3-O-phosphotransferase
MTMMDRGIVGLPIHDAVAVPADIAREVATILEDAAMAVVGVHIPVSIDVLTP